MLSTYEHSSPEHVYVLTHVRTRRRVYVEDTQATSAWIRMQTETAFERNRIGNISEGITQLSRMHTTI
jgi:hypothetical protein